MAASDTPASVSAARFVSRQLRSLSGVMLIGAGASIGSVPIGVAGIALLLPAIIRASYGRASGPADPERTSQST